MEEPTKGEAAPAPGDARERSRSPRSGVPPPPPAAPAGEPLMPDGFESKRSRFMAGPNGEPMHKWKVEYATRGGNGRAQCRQPDCLHKAEDGSALIEKGALRIGRRVLMKDPHSPDEGDKLMIFWHHARCLFHGFSRAREDTRIITYDEDMEGFEDLHFEDKDALRREMRMVGSGRDYIPPKGQAQATSGTPVRTSALPEPSSVKKEPRLGAIKRSIDGTPLLAEGDRVWAHFKEGTMRLKSKKPEIGMVRTVNIDNVLVQFESKDDQEARAAKYASARAGRAWFRHPQIFNGPKQHLPKKYLDLKRPLPLRCGCFKQQDGHGTASGCSCTPLGGRNKVYGLDFA